MSRPQTIFEQVDTPPSRPAPTDTSVTFFTGTTERGPANTPVRIRSFAEYQATFGGRAGTAQAMSDDVETYFRLGGAEAYISRQVGPAPVQATANIFDQAGSTPPGDVALVANAVTVGVWGALPEYGTWANGLNVEIVVSGSDFRVKVTHDTDTTVNEDSGLVATRDDAVTWSATSKYIRLVLGASNEDPRAQTVGLATGTDDAGNITDTQRTTATNAFNALLGPGQIRMPQATTAGAHGILLTHAEANNRRALLDPPNSTVAATLAAAATVARALAGAEEGAMFGPWALVQGTAGGTSRQVPWGAVEAALIAKSDRLYGNPNKAVAGDNGIAGPFVIGLAASFTDTELNTLHDAGFNVARDIRGQFKTYGYRTLVSPVTGPLDYQFNFARTGMAIRAQLEAILERYMFEQLDGQGGVTVSNAKRDIISKLGEFERIGALHPLRDVDTGEVLGPAFRVEVSATGELFNELLGEANVRYSPHIETVRIRFGRVGQTLEV